MSQYAPKDSLAFVEANNLSTVVTGIEETNAWQAFGHTDWCTFKGFA